MKLISATQLVNDFHYVWTRTSLYFAFNLNIFLLGLGSCWFENNSLDQIKMVKYFPDITRIASEKLKQYCKFVNKQN